MAEQRQQFRFRLPWLAASQPQPAPAPRPRAPAPGPAPNPAASTPTAPQPRTPASAPVPAQRPPFRPAGVAQPARAEPAPSPSRATPQTRVSPPSPTRPAQIPETTPRSPAHQASPQTQEPPKASPPFPGRPTLPPPSQPDLKFPVPPRKEPNTIEISQQPKEPMKPETQLPLAQEPRLIEATTPLPPPEKVMESLAEEKKLPEAPRDPVKEASSLKPETERQPIKAEEPREMPKGIYPDESEKKTAVPDEVVIEKKEVQGHEKITRAAHRTAVKDKKEDSPKPVQKHEHPYSVITLSGENTGAVMHLTSSDSTSKRERSIHIHRGYKSNPYESIAGTTNGDEGRFRAGKSQDQTQVPEEEEATENIYVNNNIQGINNSLVFNSTLNQRNPGVHLALSRLNPVEPVVRSGKEQQTIEARKAEVATTPTERLAYAPTIRRRCLKGLFLESSDSEADNPKKPRRHGCRVGCNQKSTDEKN